jgi:2-isopropylmalate synthase
MLANSIYSGVPSHYFGMEQVIEIGPMSGKSNVYFWLERHGYQASDELVDRIYQRAKQSDRMLTDVEIQECCQSVSDLRSEMAS